MQRDDGAQADGDASARFSGTASAGTAAAGNNASRPPLLPAVSLPKGGGAIRGLGETFSVNPATGSGAGKIPIGVSPGRSGFGPELALSYDTASGNGPFGYGWSLAVAKIGRRTEQGLPRYADLEESDAFIVSGSEELVPVLAADGRPIDDVASAPGFTVRRYRPRVEGAFARIERWTRQVDGAVHFRSITRENVTTLYGRDDDSRVFDPERGPQRTFEWLVCASYDDRGNAIVYEYAGEDDAGVALDNASEQRRSRSAGRYLKRVKYGNRAPCRFESDLEQAEWLFEVVFDYDEGHLRALPADPSVPLPEQHRQALAASATLGRWRARPDPFSSYRAGFEIRMHRRCQRVLVFHRFDELGAEPCLVRSTDFDYADRSAAEPEDVDAELAHQGSTRFGSFLRRVTQSGYVRKQLSPPRLIDGIRYVEYLQRSLPPLEFEYSRAEIHEDVRELDEQSRTHLPAGVDGSTYAWVDLDGEGISGVLTRKDASWHYKPNLGSGRLGAKQTLSTQPALFAHAVGDERMLDLAGDGSTDVVSFSARHPGYYERNSHGGWDGFRAFKAVPNLDFSDPNLRFVDLNGDGHADILVTENDVFTWFRSRGEDGFEPPRRERLAASEERGPRVLFGDASQCIFLADLSGDGLSDIVRIRRGDVCYWPNLGYGSFGAKVAMDNAPVFDAPEQFDPRRLRLADLDGSGTTDIVYLARDGARLYFNRSGNGWSDARTLGSFPAAHGFSSVNVADLMGQGTACLIWSSSAPRDATRPLRYIDLLGGQKPHLLVRSSNNLGAETRVAYAPSTRFYLADKAAKKPWVTKLPFPVHVVERVEVHDLVQRNRFVTRYRYHHGYFDPFEREFRGFGCVEQIDTEELAALTASGAPAPGLNFEAQSHVPPTLTKNWFHTGAYLGRDRISNFYAGLKDAQDQGEYFREPGLLDEQARALLLADTVLPPGLGADEEREACRALRGSLLRREVYALDGSEKERLPYSTVERSYELKLLQKTDANQHAVFLVHLSEELTHHYERALSLVRAGELLDDTATTDGAGAERLLDPRVAHSLTLEVDDQGNVLKSVNVAYPRRFVASYLPAAVRDEQARARVVYTEQRVTNAIDTGSAHRTSVSCEARTFELTGYTGSGPSGRFRAADFVRPSPTHPGSYELIFDGEVEYHEQPTSSRQRRRVEHARTLFRRDDLSGPLPLGRIESMALPFESYELALTPGLVAATFGPKVDDDMLGSGSAPPGAGYVHTRNADEILEPDWWVPSGRVFYSPDSTHTATQELAYARAHFFMPCRAHDAFHASTLSTESFVEYDDYQLLASETRDALGNRTTVAEHDYRVLMPALGVDSNGNRTRVAFDAFGRVVATALMGKAAASPAEGDRLSSGFRADPTDGELARFFADPLGALAATLLDDATTRIVYDTRALVPESFPAKQGALFTATLTRESHASEPLPANGLRIRTAFAYSDGFGREIQQRARVDPGPVPARHANGMVLIDAEGRPVLAATPVEQRWASSGHTVFNNKGKPVRRYEPYFSERHEFEFDVRVGKSPVLFYDPLSRVIGRLLPDHTWEKVIFDPWRLASWDVGDTLLIEQPDTDPDIGNHFARLPAVHYLPTWHARRRTGALGPDERAVAENAEIHAGTPTLAHADSMGRTALRVAHNRFRYTNAPAAAASEEFHATRFVLDVEGNQLEVIDARGRLVARHTHDVRGNLIRQQSMEGGQRWSLNDAAGKPLYTWGERGFRFRTGYDVLRRAVSSFLLSGAGPELLVGRSVYGESRPNAETANLRGRLFAVFDQAGVLTSDAYDFKGNLRRAGRRLARDYDATLDWSTEPALEAATYVSSTRYDALNRPTQVIAPHSDQSGSRVNVMQPSYGVAGLLARMDVWLGRNAEPSSLLEPASTPPSAVGVSSVDYDARGRRLEIRYRNGVATSYGYDADNSHLVRVYSRRGPQFTEDCDNPTPPPATVAAPETPPPGVSCGLQNLEYHYDPLGNVAKIRDSAQPTLYFRNTRVDPSAEFLYDATSRLIEATGREHLGQVGGSPLASSYDDAPHTGLPHPGDGNAMGRYLERYTYDTAGNLVTLQHRGTAPGNPGWTRQFLYEEASALEPTEHSNRLSATVEGTGPGALEARLSTSGDGYDAHGNLLRMPQLTVMRWNERDQLSMSQRQAVNASDTPGQARQGERTYYVYDAGGRRVRKVTEFSNGELKDERIYLGALEIYRKPGASNLVRETLHVSDDSRRIAIVETRTAGTEPNVPPELVRYQLSNHLGSASLELDEAARLVSYEEYTPFGSTSYQAVRSQTEVPKRYRYTGMERDEESGLAYHSTRYYAPWLGRWTAADPAGLVDGENLYRYARDNPVLLVDPSGMDPPRSRYSLGEFTLRAGEPVNDPQTHAALFDATFPGAGGLLLNLLDLGNRTDNRVGRGFLNLAEFGVTGLAFYGPTVYSHEWAGHVGAWSRVGVPATITEFSWFNGVASPDTSSPAYANVTSDQHLAINVAGANQQSLNAAATYNRVARFGFYTPQDAWAYLLGQAGTGAYAIRTWTLANPPGKDDIHAYQMGARSWSTEGIAVSGTITALPALIGLIWSGYQFIANNRRRIEVPSLSLGNARLTFPNTQTLLTSQGTVLSASSELSFRGVDTSFLLGVDVRPTSDFALALSITTHGFHVPGTPLQLNGNLRLTGAGTPGIWGGVDIGLDVCRGFTLRGGFEAGTNDIRTEAEGRTSPFRLNFGGSLSF